MLLQTAQCHVLDTSGQKSVMIKALFDSCFQQTYISENIARELHLKPKRQVQMVVKAFGNGRGKTMQLKEYELKVKPKYGETFSVNAVAVPTICSPITGQIIQEAIDQNRFIAGLKLADGGSKPNAPIDLLFGADIYWKIVSGEVKKCNDSGLTAINSVFGWLLSGPVKRRNESSINLVSTDVTVMKISAHVTEDTQLANEIRRFWDLDTIGISEPEVSVYDKFNETIKFENGRYEVELPFK